MMIIKLTKESFQKLINKIKYYKNKNKQKDIIIDGLNKKIQKANEYSTKDI